MPFDHEKLDVYGVAVDFVSRANQLIESLPRGRGYLADQLQRAALSVVLNIAEGAGKYSGNDKASFYARARGSTTESAAILDVCARLGLISADACRENKAVLERVGRMLTKLVRTHHSPLKKPGSDSGSGSGSDPETRSTPHFPARPTP